MTQKPNTLEAERNEQMMVERVLTEEPYRAMARRYGVNHARCQQIVRETQRKLIDGIEMDLLVARKEGDTAVSLWIPPQAAAAQDRATRWLAWVLAELAKRDVDVRWRYLPAPDGTIFFELTDVTDYKRGSRNTRRNRIGGKK